MLLWPKTPTGELKTERAVLSRHAADHPALAALLDVRRLDTRLSTFGDKLVDHVVDGRLPVSLNSPLTKSGWRGIRLR
jgi:DNA polymerase I-like protein with 3'-5' exonuclease and polymerase domains